MAFFTFQNSIIIVSRNLSVFFSGQVIEEFIKIDCRVTLVRVGTLICTKTGEMSQFGHVSAVNMSRQSNVVSLWSSHSAWSGRHCFRSGQVDALSFGVSDSMGDKLKAPIRNSVVMRSRKLASPLKVYF